MNNILVLTLLFVSLSFSSIAQPLRTHVEYNWDKVTDIKLYHAPDNDGSCYLEKLKEIAGDSAYAKPCDWKNLHSLIKDWTRDGNDVALEAKCIVLVVDFGGEKISFMVFMEQGALFDLTENTFQYLNIPDKARFKEAIEECIK